MIFVINTKILTPAVGLSVSPQILQVREKSLRTWYFVCPYLRQQYPFYHFKEASYSSQSKSVLKRSVNSKRLCPLNNSIIH